MNSFHSFAGEGDADQPVVKEEVTKLHQHLHALVQQAELHVEAHPVGKPNRLCHNALGPMVGLKQLLHVAHCDVCRNSIEPKAVGRGGGVQPRASRSRLRTRIYPNLGICPFLKFLAVQKRVTRVPNPNSLCKQLEIGQGVMSANRFWNARELNEGERRSLEVYYLVDYSVLAE